MKSIRQAASKLPGEFVDRLYSLFGTHQAEKIMRGLSADRLTTLRVNTTKMDVRTCMALLGERGIKVEKVPWNPLALVVKNRNEKALEELEMYCDGAIYLQSLSSQLPPLVVDPRPEERILDMTAAPGGKTTQMAAMMNNKGYVLATEVNEIRCERLKHNIRVQGASIVEVSLEDAKYAGRKRHEEFDRVLLDAPCSGEGLFVADRPGTYRYWSVREVRKLASEQRRLISEAVEALKPGGSLIYSTCTMAPEENEAVVDTALRRFPGLLAIEPISILVPGAIPGVTAWGDARYSPEVTKAVRILPSELLEGFFVCKLKKLGTLGPATPKDNKEEPH